MRSAAMHYRTAHLHHPLFVNYRVDNDLGVAGEIVEIPTRLDSTERRNPRKEDRQLASRLISHLNEHVEYYHQAVWLAMDPNRRYLLLDGFVAPNADGRSVASVVEDRLVGIVGNCLVMPVVPGLHLDPFLRARAPHRRRAGSTSRPTTPCPPCASASPPGACSPMP